MAERTVAVGDGRLAVREEGGGRPVVLLHGGGLDHRLWDDQVDDLAVDHRVIAVDARGHGRSSTPSTPFRHGEDVAALLGALEVGPATLVGLSLGAGTAIDVALDHPELVSALVVSGAGTSEPDFRDPWVLDVFARWGRAQEAGDPQGWVAAFLRFTSGPHRALDDVRPDVVRRCREMVTDTLERHVLPGFADGRPPVFGTPGRRTWQRLPDLAVPVLAIIGGVDADDHIRMAERVARDVPDGATATIGGTAHYPNLERPDRFTQALRAFLDETAGATT